MIQKRDGSITVSLFWYIFFFLRIACTVNLSRKAGKAMMNETQKIMGRMGEESYLCEANEDFLLPDYMPEIRRVLRLDASLSPDEPILRAGEAELEGKLLYKLLYTDESGALTEAPLEGHYRTTASLGEGEDTVLAPYEKIESVSFRPVGPRKLSVRTKVRVCPRAYGAKESVPALHTLLPAGESFETLPATQAVLSLYSAMSDGLEAEFVTRPEGQDMDSLRVLATKGDMLVENATAQDGRVTLYGTLFPHAVLAAEGGAPFVVSRRLPFEAELSCPEAKAGDTVLGYGLFDGMDIVCEGTGEDAELVFTLRYRVRALGERNECLSYIKDAYAVGKDTAIMGRAVTGQTLVGGCTGTASLDYEEAAEEETEGEVLLSAITVRESHIRPFGDKAIIEGEARAELVVETENGCSCQTMTFPFRMEAALGAPTTESDTLRYTLHPAYAIGSISGGRRRVNAEMAYTVSSHRDFSLSLPATVTVTEKEKKDDAFLKVYYPKGEDSLFSVGKAFSLSLDRLAAINEMPPPSAEEAHLTKSLDGYAWLFVSDT